MENVNLKEARKGDFPKEEKSKTEYMILSSICCCYKKTRIEDSDDFSRDYSARVRFFKDTLTNETRSYWVTEASVVARLVSGELKVRDLAEVRFSERKEVVEMVKFGRLCFEGETT